MQLNLSAAELNAAELEYLTLKIVYDIVLELIRAINITFQTRQSRRNLIL